MSLINDEQFSRFFTSFCNIAQNMTISIICIRCHIFSFPIKRLTQAHSYSLQSSSKYGSDNELTYVSATERSIEVSD